MVSSLLTFLTATPEAARTKHSPTGGGPWGPSTSVPCASAFRSAPRRGEKKFTNSLCDTDLSFKNMKSSPVQFTEFTPFAPYVLHEIARTPKTFPKGHQTRVLGVTEIKHNKPARPTLGTSRTQCALPMSSVCCNGQTLLT